MALNTDILTAPEKNVSFDITQRTEIGGGDSPSRFIVIDIVEVVEVPALTYLAGRNGRFDGLNFLSSNGIHKPNYYLPSALDSDGRPEFSVGYQKTISWGVKEDQRTVGSFMSTQEVSARLAYRVSNYTYLPPSVTPETTVSYPITVTVTLPSGANRCVYYLRNLYGVFSYFQPGGSPADGTKSANFTITITQPAVLLLYGFNASDATKFGAGRLVVYR